MHSADVLDCRLRTGPIIFDFFPSENLFGRDPSMLQKGVSSHYFMYLSADSAFALSATGGLVKELLGDTVSYEAQ